MTTNAPQADGIRGACHAPAPAPAMFRFLPAFRRTAQPARIRAGVTFRTHPGAAK